MSSQFCFPFLISTRVFITSMMSSLERTPSPISSSFPNLLLNFILPTSDKSYLSALKNKFSNRRVAASFVGGSPGRIILYISAKASRFVAVVSDLNVSEM